VHEAGVAQSALETAAAKARERGATRVHRLTLRVGDLSGVVPEALLFALEALSPGTAAEGAAFDIEVVPVECHCPACDRLYPPADVVYASPACGRVKAC
jgi:hydrogenase nickel incorporation protein HypA/HybF